MEVVTRMRSTYVMHCVLPRQVVSVSCCLPRVLAVETQNLSRKPALRHSTKRQGDAIVVASHGDGDLTLRIADRVTKSGRPIKKHLPFYVKLPADTVSDCSTLNHCKAIKAGLLALKALGVDGVVMQVWWGIVEGDAPTKYDWAAYLCLVKMIQTAGLKVQVSICFHGNQKKPKIGLPSWVLQVGESDPNIFFADRAGNCCRDCLSLAIDNLPLFQGRSPLEIFSGLFKSFREAFSDYMGNTIVEVCVGLGPDGELRYPSFPENQGMWKFPGVGEFQCYDKYMLANLKQHSQEMGHPEWGQAGPHDAPSYSQGPHEGGFFADDGGAWNSPYGEFFLSWYTSQLLAHGDRMLSLAANIFKEDMVIIAGKLPVVHWWYKTKSHAAELTSGFYNIQGLDGYDAFMEMFAKNESLVILPKMDDSDMKHPSEAKSSPESVFLQIRRASHKYGVPVTGENSLPCNDNAAFKRILDNFHLTNSSQLPVLTSFTYSSMGQTLYSPENWRLFVNFFRNIDEYASVADQSNMPLQDGEAASHNFSCKQKHKEELVRT